MTMPNFLILGAAKSGTTALYHYLGQHPEIFFPAQKEPGFFAYEGECIDFRGPDDVQYRSTVTEETAYRELFRDVSTQTAIGEASAIYLYSPSAPLRIRHHVPDAKLIAILRDPIERAYSSYMHLVRDAREPLGDFAEALRDEERRIGENWGPLWHYKRRGLYSAQVKRYLDLFDRRQLAVYLYDDFQSDAGAVLKDIFRFLGVDETFVPNTSLRYNVSGIPRSRAIHALIMKPNVVTSLVGPLVPERLRWRIKLPVANWNLAKPPISAEARRLLAPEFKEDILRLQKLIGRDLTAWLRSTEG
jgi:hypothetical protein